MPFKKDFLIAKGELVPLTLSVDTTEPVIIHCEVMSEEDEALFQFFKMDAMNKVEVHGANDYAAMAEKIRVAVGQNRAELKRKVMKLSNIPADETHTEPWETMDRSLIDEFVDLLMPEQAGELRGALSSYSEMRKLKFRVDPVSGDEAGEGEGGSGEQEDTGPAEGSV